MLLSAMFAALAAVANATASVLQRKGARRQRGQRSRSLKVIWDLAHEPVWFGGIAAIIAGFLLQASALATGPIVLVQPILVVELPMTLLLAGIVFGNRLHGREWLAVTGMTVGLALLLIALSPSGGDVRHAPALGWAVGSGVSLGTVLVLAIAGRRAPNAHRPAYLGTATGISFGFTAALVAGITAALAERGAIGLVTAWQTYAVVLVGPAGFVLLQLTLRAGRLVVSQPGLTLSNPLVAVGWGIGVFGEQVRQGVWLLGDVVGLALIAGATLLLAGSPLLREDHARSGPVRSG